MQTAGIGTSSLKEPYGQKNPEKALAFFPYL
jgi:hypothetical protein